jgi:hypothetical protein
VSKPSHADMRAWLTVLILREGMIEISNAELYDAMMPSGGSAAARFAVEETTEGVRVSLSLDPEGSA